MYIIETYSRLNIAFDKYSGESQVSEEAMAKIAVEMEEKNISRVDNGAVLVDFTKLLPGKEGKRLGVTVIRYVLSSTRLVYAHKISNFLGTTERGMVLPCTSLVIFANFSLV
jgi:hypothetical protein